MSSLFNDLDMIPEPLRYAPPIRKPHVQAAVDMERRMIYGLYEREVMPAVPTDRTAPDTRPASPTPADQIADLMRELTYGEMMELARELWTVNGEEEITQQSLSDLLHRWATTR